MAAEPNDRLSALPDDLLLRILGFAPAREATSTAAVSRRWRGLWPKPAPAVILDNRSYDRMRVDESERSSGRHCDIDRDAFFRDAEAALAAHGPAGVRSLAVHVEADGPEYVQFFMSQHYRHYRDAHYITDDVLAHPACRAVEELTIEASTYMDVLWTFTARRRAYHRKHEESEVANERVGYYKLSLGSVPSEAIHLLHITNCNDLTLPAPPAAAAFPCLATLWLQRCVVSLCTLQDMIVASPQLFKLQLECVYIKTKACRPTSPDDDGEDHGGDDGFDDNGPYGYSYYGNRNRNDDNGRDGVERFCFPGITSLVLVNCSWKGSLTIELDAPRVRSFRYRGHISQLLVLKYPPPLPELQRADLHLLDCTYYGQEKQTCERFWLFIKNFSNARFLKLKLGFVIGDIAIADKERNEELLRDALFCNLERLEVDGEYVPGCEAVGVAIGNLLQCCPVVRDLRLKLNAVDRTFGRRGQQSDWSEMLYKSTFLDRRSKLDIRKSVEHFARRRNLEVCLAGEEGYHGDQCGLPADISGLSDKWYAFDCLRGSLRRVSLQFRMDKKPNSFNVQLIRFFFERATVLEEIYVDDGKRKMCEHMNRKIGGCTDNATHPCSEYQVSAGVSQLFGNKEARRRNLWSTSFRILPLKGEDEKKAINNN